MALSVEVLRALALPASVTELARALEVPEPHLRLELASLERRGYVRRLTCEPSACGWCAFKAACRSSDDERWLRS